MNKLNIKRKGKKSDQIFVGSLCLDQMSSWMPIEYKEPDIIKGIINDCDRKILKKIRELHADQYNDGFMDEYIDKLIELAVADLEKQRISHKKVINDIRIGQQSQLDVYKRELEKLERELFELKQEVLA